MTAPHLFRHWELLRVGPAGDPAWVCNIDGDSLLVQHDGTQTVVLYGFAADRHPILIGCWGQPSIAAVKITLYLFKLSSEKIPVPINLRGLRTDSERREPRITLREFEPFRHIICMSRANAEAIGSALGRNPFDNPQEKML